MRVKKNPLQILSHLKYLCKKVQRTRQYLKCGWEIRSPAAFRRTDELTPNGANQDRRNVCVRLCSFTSLCWRSSRPSSPVGRQRPTLRLGVMSPSKNPTTPVRAFRSIPAPLRRPTPERPPRSTPARVPLTVRPSTRSPKPGEKSVTRTVRWWSTPPPWTRPVRSTWVGAAHRSPQSSVESTSPSPSVTSRAQSTGRSNSSRMESFGFPTSRFRLAPELRTTRCTSTTSNQRATWGDERLPNFTRALI